MTMVGDFGDETWNPILERTFVDQKVVTIRMDRNGKMPLLPFEGPTKGFERDKVRRHRPISGHVG